MAVNQYFETKGKLYNFGKGKKGRWFPTPPLHKPETVMPKRKKDRAAMTRKVLNRATLQPKKQFDFDLRAIIRKWTLTESNISRH